MTLLARTPLAFGLMFYGLIAFADIKITDYRELAEDPKSGVYDLLANYVDGLGTGAFWSNARFNEIYGVPLYCPTAGVQVTADDYMAILKDTVEKYDPGDHELIGNLLVIGLMETYPCK